MRRSVVLMIISLAAVGCAGAAVSPSPPPRATSFEEFAVGMCDAFESMDKAVGNPDTGAGSDLSNDLEAAAEKGDRATAEQLARQVTAHLENGRARAAFAGGWAPGAASAEHMDALLVAFEAWTSAQVEAAGQGLDASHAQQAFEQAGGLEAWQGMFQAIQTMAASRPPVPPHACPTVAVSL